MHTMKTSALALLALASSLVACAARRAPVASFEVVDPSVRAGVDGPALALLDQYAQDVDGPTRAAALEVLVRASVDPAGGRFGVAATWDPEPWVQRAALRALSQRGNEPESVARLAELAARSDVDPSVRCRAAVLLPTPVSESVQAATRAGWERAPLWRGLPCAAADAGWGSEAARDRVLEAVEQGAMALDPDLVRTLAAIELAGLEGALVSGLEAADELVRPALTTALLVRGDPAGLAAVRDSLSDADPLVRMEAVLLLAPIDRPEATQQLAKAANDTPEGQVASLVLAAREGSGFRVFEEAFDSDNRDIRRAAVRYGGEHVQREESASSGRSSRKRCEKLLARALVEPDPSTRAEALRQTGLLGMTGLRPVVEALLADTDAEDHVRIAAAGALVSLDARL